MPILLDPGPFSSLPIRSLYSGVPLTPVALGFWFGPWSPAADFAERVPCTLFLGMDIRVLGVPSEPGKGKPLFDCPGRDGLDFTLGNFIPGIILRPI